MNFTSKGNHFGLIVTERLRLLFAISLNLSFLTLLLFNGRLLLSNRKAFLLESGLKLVDLLSIPTGFIPVLANLAEQFTILFAGLVELTLGLHELSL